MSYQIYNIVPLKKALANKYMNSSRTPVDSFFLSSGIRGDPVDIDPSVGLLGGDSTDVFWDSCVISAPPADYGT